MENNSSDDTYKALPIKEPLSESARFKVFLSTVILEILIYASGWVSTNYGFEVPAETLNFVAASIAGLAMTFIHSRTKRNTVN